DRSPDRDYFTFTAAGTGDMTVSVDSVAGVGWYDIDVREAGTGRLPGIPFIDQAEGGSTLNFSVVAGREYSIEVTGQEQSITKRHDLSDRYRLTITGPALPDAFEPANNTQDGAVSLGTPGTVTLTGLAISSFSDVDYYVAQFPVSGKAAFIIAM